LELPETDHSHATKEEKHSLKSSKEEEEHSSEPAPGPTQALNTSPTTQNNKKIPFGDLSWQGFAPVEAEERRNATCRGKFR